MQGKSLYDESLLAQGSRRGRGDSWDREEDGNGDASGDGLGPCGAILQVMRLYTGSGILAFPYAVSCGGLWAGIGGLVLIAIINLVTLHISSRKANGGGGSRVMEMDPFSMSQSEQCCCLARACQRNSQCSSLIWWERPLAVLARRYPSIYRNCPSRTECGLSHIHRSDAEGCISLSEWAAPAFLGCQRT